MNIVEVATNKLVLWTNVSVDYRTAERPIIASNDPEITAVREPIYMCLFCVNWITFAQIRLISEQEWTQKSPGPSFMKVLFHKI